MTWRVEHGDCLEVMAGMEVESVDACVCDPPYGLSREPDITEVLTHWLAGDDYKHRGGGFMGRSWDSFVPGPAYWRAVYRVLKPGAHLLAFGGTRTYDLLCIALRLAGFEIRDRILSLGGGGVEGRLGSELAWVYGSGFPKSLDVSKAIDRADGVEREVIGQYQSPDGARRMRRGLVRPVVEGQSKERAYRHGGSLAITGSVTSDAQQWEGFGTSLKPSHEPIAVARKPFKGTVAGNVVAYGTGALNIDGCRVGMAERPVMVRTGTVVEADAMSGKSRGATPNGEMTTLGRFPSNVVLSHNERCVQVGSQRIKGDNRDTGNGRRTSGFADIGASVGDGEPNGAVYGDEDVVVWACVPGCAVRALDEQTGQCCSAYPGAPERAANYAGTATRENGVTSIPANIAGRSYSDAGAASRFFPTFLGDSRVRYVAKASTRERNAGLGDGASLFTPEGAPDRNRHETVKPVELMRWLVRLVTPPGGVVLDPFTGSGSTGIACVLEGFDFIGIEQDEQSVQVARARLSHWSNGHA